MGSRGAGFGLRRRRQVRVPPVRRAADHHRLRRFTPQPAGDQVAPMDPSTLSKIDPPVSTVSLNEPHRRNALSPTLVEALIEALEGLRDDSRIRAVIIDGSGPGFCAGADLRRMRVASPIEDRDEYDRILLLNKLLWEYPKPTVAAVHGFALGAGANLMTWCDFVVADEATRIGYPEVKVGVPSASVVPTLERLVGRRRMLELILLGESVSPAEAQRIGLINRVAPSGSVPQVSMELALQLAEINPDAVRYTKEIVQATADTPYRQAMTYAKEARVIARLRAGFTVTARQGADRPPADTANTEGHQ